LRERKEADPKDFNQLQREKLRHMSSGRPPKERMTIPEGVEVFMYGNQKLNIWEFQKEQVRLQIADDVKHFYSYSKDFLSLAFPLVNENEIRAKEKQETEARWKTQNGFDTLIKKTNYNEHPKKPPQSIIDDLQIPYVEQLREKQAALKPSVAQIEEGKVDFRKDFRCPQTFSDREFFNTIFISGEGLEREMEEEKKKEYEEWKSKIVVGNPHFKVDTLIIKKPT